MDVSKEIEPMTEEELAMVVLGMEYIEEFPEVEICYF